MSRIRSIHPGLWTDDSFMSLSAFARLLYIGLLNEAWDDGVFEWKPLTIKARIFPVDSVDVPALLDELVEADKIAERDDSKRYGLIRNFREFQRPKKPNSSGLLRDEDREYVGIVPDHSPTASELSPQMEDGGGRVEEEDRTSPPVIEAEGARVSFEDLVEAYPRSIAGHEASARKAFERTKPAERSAILAAASRLSKHHAEDSEERGRTMEAGERFLPTMPKWLETEQWRDSANLPLKSESAKPVLPMTKIDRFINAELFAECERIGREGKRAPLDQWSFPNEVVDQARTNLSRAREQVM